MACMPNLPVCAEAYKPDMSSAHVSACESQHWGDIARITSSNVHYRIYSNKRRPQINTTAIILVVNNVFIAAKTEPKEADNISMEQ